MIVICINFYQIYPRATSAKAKRIILTSNNSDVTCTLWEPHCNGDIKEGNDLVLYDVRVTEHGLETMAGSYLEVSSYVCCNMKI